MSSHDAPALLPVHSQESKRFILKKMSSVLLWFNTGKVVGSKPEDFFRRVVNMSYQMCGLIPESGILQQ